MIAVAIAFLFPVYALVTLSRKDPRQIAAAPLSPQKYVINGFSSGLKG